MKVDPALFPTLEGSTDSELMFRLALTYGLEQTPLPALERMVGVVERRAASRGRPAQHDDLRDRRRTDHCGALFERTAVALAVPQHVVQAPARAVSAQPAHRRSRRRRVHGRVRAARRLAGRVGGSTGEHGDRCAGADVQQRPFGPRHK